MLRRTLRNFIVGTPLEKTARGIFSRFDARCRASTAEMRDNPQMFEVMQRVLKSDSNAIDIGANEGDMLRHMTACAPRGKHYAFEPIPALAAKLKAEFPSVAVHEVALSDYTGNAEFQMALDTTGFSSLRLDSSMLKQTRVQTLAVAVDQLDEVLPHDYTPTLIKIDVEGAEFQALWGGRETILRTRPFLIFECAQASAKNFQTTADMMYDLFTNDFNLKISRMNDWLEGRAPLDRRGFAKIFRAGLLWNFLAHP